MEYYTHEKITPSTTKITNMGDVFCFLVEGNDSAVLIDTGTGAGNLKDYVERLTAKPVSVLLTHGHCDHAGGAGPFETVYLNQADWELASGHAGIEMRKSYLSFVLGESGGELTDESMCPDRTLGYLPLMDGVMKVCRQIMAGEDDGVPYSFMDYKGLKLAKNVTVPGMRTDGGLGNIVYNPAHIFRKGN